MRLIILIALCVLHNLSGQNSKPRTMADTFPCNKWSETAVKTDSGWLLRDKCRFNVLYNDKDPDGDKMKIMRFNGREVKGIDSVVMIDTGVAYLSENGQFHVKMKASFVGTVTFTYTVNDGQFILGIWKGKSGAPSKGTIIYRKEW